MQNNDKTYDKTWLQKDKLISIKLEKEELDLLEEVELLGEGTGTIKGLER